MPTSPPCGTDCGTLSRGKVKSNRDRKTPMGSALRFGLLLSVVFGASLLAGQSAWEAVSRSTPASMSMAPGSLLAVSSDVVSVWAQASRCGRRSCSGALRSQLQDSGAPSPRGVGASRASRFGPSHRRRFRMDSNQARHTDARLRCSSLFPSPVNDRSKGPARAVRAAPFA